MGAAIGPYWKSRPRGLPNSVGRVGRVEDIANAVAFLASPLAGFINANLRVDGGAAQSVN